MSIAGAREALKKALGALEYSRGVVMYHASVRCCPVTVAIESVNKALVELEGPCTEARTPVTEQAKATVLP